jgi:4-amino-4-deoxy-L-arabinose transferase-like glycosyltransferase
VLGCSALLLGVAVLSRRIGALILLSVATFLLYFLIFENVHFVHTFYQVANGVFLIAAVSIAIAGMMDRFPKYSIPLLAFFMILIYGNLSSFFVGPHHNNTEISSPSGASPERWDTETIRFDDTNNKTIAVSKLILRSTSEDKPILVYGYDWASDISFFSQRRSFTVPTFFPPYAEVIEDPARYLGQQPSAIVLCGAHTSAQLAPKVDKFFRPSSKVTVQDCDIYLKSQRK